MVQDGMGPRGCIPIGLVRTSPRINKTRADEKVEEQEVNSLLGFTIIEIYQSRERRSHTVRNWGLHGLSIRTSPVITAMELMKRSDGHLVSFDIPRVALQKTKWVIDQGLGGLMWWAVDEDWVDSPASAPVKRDMKKKTKRACKAKGAGEGEIGYVHAVDPANATVSTGSADSTSATASISISDSALAQVSSTALSSESASPSDNVSSAYESVSVSASASSARASESAAASDSATSTDSAAPVPSSSQPSTSEAEGSKDGIQLNIGRSLVQVAKEGFERYASGLDGTQNVLGYPSSGMSSLAVDGVS